METKVKETLNSSSELTSALNVSPDISLTLPPSSTDNSCQKASDLDMLAEGIKEKLLMSPKSEKN